MKMKQYDELDENGVDRLSQSKPEYDLSTYCDKHIDKTIHDGDELLKSGLYGLENILYGEAMK